MQIAESEVQKWNTISATISASSSSYCVFWLKISVFDLAAKSPQRVAVELQLHWKQLYTQFQFSYIKVTNVFLIQNTWSNKLFMQRVKLFY